MTVEGTFFFWEMCFSFIRCFSFLIGGYEAGAGSERAGAPEDTHPPGRRERAIAQPPPRPAWPREAGNSPPPPTPRRKVQVPAGTMAEKVTGRSSHPSMNWLTWMYTFLPAGGAGQTPPAARRASPPRPARATPLPG